MTLEHVNEMIRCVTPSIGREITSYTVPLVYMNKSRGSGVLVKTNEIHGILTASHTIHGHGGIDFNATNEGLLRISLSTKPNRFGIPIQYLTEVVVGAPEEKEYGPEGPDLTFVRVPQNYVGDIEAQKSFLNLDRIYTEDWKYDLDDPCVISGYPEILQESVAFREEQGLYIREMQLYGYFNRTNYSKADALDYMSVTVRRDQNPNLPERYHGFSGGPLWTFDFGNDDDGSTGSKNLRLVGIVYFQDEEVNGIRNLRCHFIRSIYTAIERIFEASDVEYQPGSLKPLA